MSALPVSVKGVLVHEGRVLLLLNERDEWDLPGGRPDPGETFPQALEREVREETGLAATVGAALDEHLFEVLPGRFVRIVPFQCHLVGDGAVTLSPEHLDVRWLPVAEVTAEGAGEVVAGHRLPDCYRAAIRQATRQP
ncbi:MAG: NUDIX domain-containing protein [Proteobacteria bacterium]|nr:NUDIX domain-containing protein [Pseudomonadota bacterium]